MELQTGERCHRNTEKMSSSGYSALKCLFDSVGVYSGDALHVVVSLTPETFQSRMEEDSYGGEA